MGSTIKDCPDLAYWHSKAEKRRLRHRFPFPIAIPWQNAVVCENCRSISDATGDMCPVCDHRGLWNLAAVLDGKKEGAA